MKRTIHAVALIAATVCFTSGVQAADAAAGKAVYAAKCKSCHGAEGVPSAGMAKMMPALKPLNDAGIQGKSDAVLKAAILKGVGKMKPQTVSDSDADNLVALMRTMK